jgi:tRNA-dihydrouridine synthase
VIRAFGIPENLNSGLITVAKQAHARYYKLPVVRDAAMMAEAASMNVARGAQIIDNNMGCPAKKVCKKAAGSRHC